MSQGAGVNQKELKILLASMKKFPVNIQKNVVNGSTRAAAKVVQKEMISRVPYEYGTLEDAIRVKRLRGRPTESIYSAGVKRVVLENGVHGLKNTKQYAYYLEYSTHKMDAHPFIRPSLYATGSKPLISAQNYFFARLPREKKRLGFK